MIRPSMLRIAIGLCLLSSSALADCEKIAKAMIAVEEAPGVRQKTFAGKADGGAQIAESLKLKDAMYVREGEDGKWRRAPFDAAQRKDKAEKMFKLMPLSDCAGPRASTDAGADVQVFDYAQPNPLKAGEKSRSTLWLGADGRVRRLILDDGAWQTFDYGDFEAPAVESPRRGKAR